jgi:hypothetical protein
MRMWRGCRTVVATVKIELIAGQLVLTAEGIISMFTTFVVACSGLPALKFALCVHWEALSDLSTAAQLFCRT